MSSATLSRFATVALLGSVVLGACAAPVDLPERGGGEGGTGAASSALSTKASAGEIPMPCKCTIFGNQNYCDESLTEAGENRCASDCDCNAGRHCNAGHYCEGIADNERCACTFGYQARGCNEAVNKRGPNLCDSDCDCTDGRTCDTRHGWCVGKAVGPTTCEEQCSSDYAAERQACRMIVGTKTYCLTIAAYDFAKCGERCRAK